MKTFKPKILENKFKLNLIGETNEIQFIGSTPGIILTTLSALMALLLLADIISVMNSGRNDKYSSFKIENKMNEIQQLDLNQFNFMPFLKVYMAQQFTSKEFDIFEYEKNDQNQWTALSIDVKKLSKYFSFKYIFIPFYQQNTKFYHNDFRQCTEQDFLSNNIDIDTAKHHQTGLCPDIKLTNQYKIHKNFNFNEYQFVQLALVTCDRSTQNDCKSDDEIKMLLESLYFEFFVVNEYLDFFNQNLLQKNPVLTRTSYIKELGFEFNQTVTSLSDLTHHRVITDDNRYIKQDDQIFEFIEINQKYSDKVSNYQEIQNFTTDGVNFEQRKFNILWKHYFVLSDNLLISQRKAQNLLAALGEFGGLVSFLIIITRLLGNLKLYKLCNNNTKCL